MKHAVILADERGDVVAAVSATRVRYQVLAFLCSLLFILYLDRVCISQAAAAIQAELELTNSQMGLVFVAFTLAYGLFEIPAGHWGDRRGSRAVLTRIAVWWSAFTMLTAACFGFYSLLMVRFLFGAGEAGAFPNSARIVARWFPLHERGRVQALLMAAAQVGGTVSPVVAGYLIVYSGWRLTFVLFGGLGVLWAVLFFRWFRDDPAEHPAVNEGELQLLSQSAGTPVAHHAAIPWRAVLGNRSILLLGSIMGANACASYMYHSWYPKYLQAARDVSPIQSGWLASMVLAGGLCGTLLGGLLNDWVSRRQGTSHGWRSRYGFSCLSLASLSLLGSLWMESPQWSTAAACLSCLLANSQQSNWWSSVNEVSGRHLGALFGLMNSMGIPAVMLSQYLFGALADWRGELGYTGRAQWDPAFGMYIGLLGISALCWVFVDSSRGLKDGDGEDAVTG